MPRTSYPSIPQHCKTCYKLMGYIPLLECELKHDSLYKNAVEVANSQNCDNCQNLPEQTKGANGAKQYGH